MKRIATPLLATLVTLPLLYGCKSAASPDETTRPRGQAEHPLAGKRVAVLIAEGFHDGETTVPMEFVKGLGATATVVGAEPATLKAYNSEVTVTVEKGIAQVSPADFDALIIPGGRSPAALRQNEAIVSFVKAFFATGKPVAAICHGPQVLITAGVMSGRKSTGFPEIEGELTEAGARFENASMVRDGNLITSRTPADLPDFTRAIQAALLEGPQG